MTKESYILEYIAIGRYLKVTAIDPVTALEASAIGPAKELCKKSLANLAIKKLNRKLQENKTQYISDETIV